MEGYVVGILLLAAVVGLVLWSRAQKQRRHEERVAYAKAEAAEAANPLPTATPKQKKRKKNKKGPANEPVMEETEVTEPRAQHYQFGHRLFRDLMLDVTAVRGTMAMAKNGKADAAIEKLWEGAAKMAMASEGKRDVIPGGPPTVRLLDDGLLVRMPPPRGTTECLFIAVLLKDDSVRYFTLEKAPPVLSKNPFTACEWTKDKHINFGNDAVPDPTEDAFLDFARAREN